MKPEKYIDELYCPNCGKETRQEVYSAGHERDSSGDSQTCLKCGSSYSYYTGEWYTKDGAAIKE